MASLLFHLHPESNAFPAPASPVVAKGHRRTVVVAAVLTTALSGAAAATPAFMSTPMFGLTTVATGAVLLWMAMRAAFVALMASTRWTEYAVVTRTGPMNLVAAPESTNVPVFSAALGLSIGFAITAAVSFARVDVAMAVIASALSLALLLSSISTGLRMIAGVRMIRCTRLQRDLIIAEGNHFVATVVECEAGGTLEDRREFVAVLALESDESRTITVRVFEYPVWAPVLGTEFDVWMTYDDLPDEIDGENVVIERRYDDSIRPDDPSEHRERPAAWTRPLVPRWATPDPTSATRLTTPPSGAARELLMGTAFMGLTLYITSGLAGVATTTIAVVVLFLLLGALNTVFAYAARRRAGWAVRDGVARAVAPAVQRGSIGLALIAFLNDDALAIDGPTWKDVALNDAVPVWLFMAGMGYILWRRTTDRVVTPAAFHAGLTAPMIDVQRALTTHDPEAAERLEAETGIRVGAAFFATGRPV